MAGGRFRELFNKYGRVALGVHFSVSAATIAGLFVAIKSNVDVECIFEKVGLGAISKEDKLHETKSERMDEILEDTIQNAPKRNGTTEMATSTGGALALAVLCNKALFPIRVPITIALTPPISRFLARRQLFKNGL